MKNQQPSNSRSKQIIRSKKEKQTKKETNNPKEQKHMRIKRKTFKLSDKNLSWSPSERPLSFLCKRNLKKTIYLNPLIKLSIPSTLDKSTGVTVFFSNKLLIRMNRTARMMIGASKGLKNTPTTYKWRSPTPRNLNNCKKLNLL